MLAYLAFTGRFAFEYITFLSAAYFIWFLVVSISKRKLNKCPGPLRTLIYPVKNERRSGNTLNFTAYSSPKRMFV